MIISLNPFFNQTSRRLNKDFLHYIIYYYYTKFWGNGDHVHGVVTV